MQSLRCATRGERRANLPSGRVLSNAVEPHALRALRPALLYAGNKCTYGAVLTKVGPPDWSRLDWVEPFVGSGGLLLSAPHCRGYVVSDVNPDVVDLLRFTRDNCTELTQAVERLFKADNNEPSTYLALRSEFNAAPRGLYKSALFVYLNRHGFNGLVRYNAAGALNVGFGKRVRPHCPTAELVATSRFLQRRQVEIAECDFEQALADVRNRSVVLLDSPYLPANGKAKTSGIYRCGAFTEAQQERLGLVATALARDGHYVIAFNYSSPKARAIHSGASELHELSVGTRISRTAAGRGKVAELVAVYRPATKVRAAEKQAARPRS